MVASFLKSRRRRSTAKEEQEQQEQQGQQGQEQEQEQKPALVVSCAIEMANKRLDTEFIDEYLKPGEGWTTWVHPFNNKSYTLQFTGLGGLGDAELEACFELIDETSGDDYRGSSFGWHPLAKKKEMRSPELRYILVKDGHGGPRGFTSMMPTFENSEPVLYCYEIHLKRDLLGTGLGKLLMGYLLQAAENIPSVQKVMLTCFKSNTRGLKFYRKMGFDVDESSPRERRLRGGRVVTPDYIIMSRTTRAGRSKRAVPGAVGG